MFLTDIEKAKLKENCEAIRDYLKDLVKDYPTNIRLHVDFYRRKDGHPMGISVRKYDNKIEVSGFIGGLGIVFEGERDYNHTLAWDYQDYGLELLPQWSDIKHKFNTLLSTENKARKDLMSFEV